MPYSSSNSQACGNHDRSVRKTQSCETQPFQVSYSFVLFTTEAWYLGLILRKLLLLNVVFPALPETVEIVYL